MMTKITEKTYRESDKLMRAVMNLAIAEGLAEIDDRIELEKGYYTSKGGDTMTASVAVIKKGKRKVENVYDIYIDTVRQKAAYKGLYEARWYYGFEA